MNHQTCIRVTLCVLILMKSHDQDPTVSQSHQTTASQHHIISYLTYINHYHALNHHMHINNLTNNSLVFFHVKGSQTLVLLGISKHATTIYTSLTGFKYFMHHMNQLGYYT